MLYFLKVKKKKILANAYVRKKTCLPHSREFMFAIYAKVSRIVQVAKVSAPKLVRRVV